MEKWVPEKPIFGLFGPFGSFLRLEVTVTPVFNDIWQKSFLGHVTNIYFDHLSQTNEKIWIFPIPPLNAHSALWAI